RVFVSITVITSPCVPSPWTLQHTIRSPSCEMSKWLSPPTTSILSLNLTADSRSQMQIELSEPQDATIPPAVLLTSIGAEGCATKPRTSHRERQSIERTPN